MYNTKLYEGTRESGRVHIHTHVYTCVIEIDLV